ncbi:hypothetical protein D3C81_1663710 [compost metagenome]
MVFPADGAGDAGVRVDDCPAQAARRLAVWCGVAPHCDLGRLGCGPRILAAGLAGADLRRDRSGCGVDLSDPGPRFRRDRRAWRLRSGWHSGRGRRCDDGLHVRADPCGQKHHCACGNAGHSGHRTERLGPLGQHHRRQPLRRAGPDQQGQHRQVAGRVDLPHRRHSAKHRRWCRRPEHPAANR